MGMKGAARKLVERITGTRIYRSVPLGIDPGQDISRLLPVCRIDVVFDVGANLGQSARIYLNEFPTSYVHCFEPVSYTYQRLQANLGDHERVACYQLALGSCKSKGKMVLQGSSEMSFLLDQSKEKPMSHDTPTESVEIVTLDDFCLTKGIDRINYLKIDTEGGDLEVLKGAVNMLAGHKIDLVQVEAGMNPGNSRHVPLESLKAFLESHEYFIFGIYEQVHEWPTGEPHLRRVNAIFVSQRLIDMNRRSSRSGA